MVSQPNQNLSKQERKQAKRLVRIAEQEKARSQQSVKKAGKRVLWMLIVAGVLGLLIWYIVSRLETPQEDIISRAGIHWHPELAIYVKDEKQEIPRNIGIGAVHQPMHTHDDLPAIHLEFQGIVKKQDITIGRFFEIWGKEMQSFGTNMTMTVNGVENTELANYHMQDKDKIELRYE